MRAMLTRTPRQGYLAACEALKRADLDPMRGGFGCDLVLGRRRRRLNARLLG